MMDKLLVVLTKSYPYDNGEEFLHNEIDELSRAFPKVYIISTSVMAHSQLTRKVPVNVQSFAIHGISNKYKKYLIYIFRSMKNISDKEVRYELKAKRSNTAKAATLYFSGKCKWLLKKIKQLKDLRRDIEKSDKVVIYSYWFSDLPYLAVLLKREFNNSNIRIVSRAHGYDLYEERNPGKSMPFRKVVFENIDMVYPCSMNGAYYLKSKYKEYDHKIEVSYLGTQDHGVSPSKDSEIPTIVTCSSIIPLKRLSLLLNAIEILEKRTFYLKWVCIGDGPLLLGIKNAAKEKLKYSVTNFVGRMKNEEVLSFYQNNTVDLFVNVSETEGLPVSIMEAISFGIPILATNVGGTNEIVINNITGVLVEKEITASDLADKIAITLNAKWDRKTIRKYWQDRFDAKSNYKRFVSQIQS